MEFSLFISAIALVLSQHLLLTSASQTQKTADHFVRCLYKNSPNSLNRISNVVYTPQNVAFNSTLQAYIKNGRFNRTTTPKPVAIVAAKRYYQVQAAVVCSRLTGIEIKIRSGGHDYEGSSYVSNRPFFVLDLFNMRKVKVDVGKEVAWVQSGAILGELYYHVTKKSNNTLAFPGGVCSTVGVGGHITGGGYGTLMRKYGLTVDNILDAKVVDAKGRILTRATMGEDLFWAIRGGGAASFGVVLEWKLHLVRVPPTVTVFAVTRTVEGGVTNVIDQWQRVAPKMDPSLFIRAEAQATKNGTLGVTFYALYLGRQQQLLTLVNSTFPLLGLNSKDCVEMTWARSIFFWIAGSPKDYVKKPIPKKGWEAIWKKMIQAGPRVKMQYNAYGGRMSEIAVDATPFPHREGNLFLMQYITEWREISLDTEDKYIRATRELHDVFTPYVSAKPREAFLNYKDIDIGTNTNGHLGFAHEYFKGNLERLLRVKAKVDPKNLFRNQQSIPLKRF
ncbi:hypothetical protein V2J09_014065 [Rumex salicifolius]